MITMDQARQYLEDLGLEQAVEVLDNTLDSAASKQPTYPRMLADLLEAEVTARPQRTLPLHHDQFTMTKLARLLFQRTLEQFDSAFQPSIDERQIRELASLAFVAEATNIAHAGTRPAWARLTWRWPWPIRPSSGATGPTSSGPTS